MPPAHRAVVVAPWPPGPGRHSGPAARSATSRRCSPDPYRPRGRRPTRASRTPGPGDLAVWGPVDGRWVAVSLDQCDGDAPMILVAVVADRPIVELDDGE